MLEKQPKIKVLVKSIPSTKNYFSLINLTKEKNHTFEPSN